jgi:hypothetical protein
LIPSQGILTKTAWQLPEALSEADWTKAGRALARIEGSISWWLGDWWAYGNHHYGDRKALVESEDWEGPVFETCRNTAVVCRAFETSRRRDVLSFKHHAEVLSIEDAQVQDRFLDWCEEILSLNDKPRSTRKLRQAVREYLDEQGWSEDESARRERAKAGITVVAHLRGDDDKHLRMWAQFNGLLVRVDRNSEWGNPFEMPADGDRDTVCAHYALYYFPYKPSLLNKIHSLKGKVLACWCYPERCHGDYLAELVNDH